MSYVPSIPHPPTVYVVQDTGVDVSSAKSHGFLRTLAGRYDRELGYDESASRLRDQLREAGEHDWLLPTGDPALIALASIFFSARVGKLKLLRWDRDTHRYEPVIIPLGRNLT